MDFERRYRDANLAAKAEDPLKTLSRHLRTATSRGTTGPVFEGVWLSRRSFTIIFAGVDMSSTTITETPEGTKYEGGDGFHHGPIIVLEDL